ncbi:MAG: ribbon-helix-helix domain-containing protein [Actinobacteria bacterium]|nr:ribbon-helix-helix domain-containing protein [Actinomycetota bacterium]
MSKVTQVAFQIDNETLSQIDALVSSEFPSRAEVLRTAVREMLARRREAQIDAELATGYGAQPPRREDEAWADLSVEGLQAADLDW